MKMKNLYALIIEFKSLGEKKNHSTLKFHNIEYEYRQRNISDISQSICLFTFEIDFKHFNDDVN